MKKINTLTLLISAFLFGGLLKVQAQDCQAYFPMKTGTAMEMSHYNDKDKLQSTVETTITEKESNAGKVVATANTIFKDAKGKQTTTGSYEMSCENGEFSMDMRGMAPAQSSPAMENMEMKIEADQVSFPSNMTVGMSLPDAKMTITAQMNGTTIMSNTTTMTNRKVVAQETITTPAGTYSCVVIEADYKTTMMGMNMDSHGKSWYSKGAGLVRSESWRNGKLEGYSLLTKLKL